MNREAETCAVRAVYSEVTSDHNELGLLLQHPLGGLKDGCEEPFRRVGTSLLRDLFLSPLKY